MVSVHRRERSDVRRRQTGEDVLEIAQVRELDAVAQQQDQVDQASENHSSAASVRRSRCSGSKTLIQREPAGSSSQWRSLRTPMRIVRDLGSQGVKITGIETLPVSVGPGYDYAVIIVLVRTDEGLTGIGEASLAGRGRGVLGILDHFADLLVGQDPARIEHWWSELVRGTFWSTGQVIMSAVAGIDIALWDLKGKRLGVPVYDLLGGPTRERVRVYRHLAGDTAEELVEDALRWREQSSRRSATARSPRSTSTRSRTGIRRPRSSGRSRPRSRCALRSATTST